MNEKYAKLFSTIENTPQHIIELARRDTTDADGVAKHKNMDVVLHAAHLVDQIISSQLTAREKEALTIKLHSLLYPNEYSEDGRASTISSLGKLFTG